MEGLDRKLVIGPSGIGKTTLAASDKRQREDRLIETLDPYGSWKDNKFVTDTKKLGKFTSSSECTVYGISDNILDVIRLKPMEQNEALKGIPAVAWDEVIILHATVAEIGERGSSRDVDRQDEYRMTKEEYEHAAQHFYDVVVPDIKALCTKLHIKVKEVNAESDTGVTIADIYR